MSKDQEKKGLPEGIDEALEVRVVAWLLGEASDFERSELEAMVRDDAAVRAFHHEMKALIGDARSAHGMDGPDDEDWKLSGDRRGAVMAELGMGKGLSKASSDKRVDRWPGVSIKRRMQWVSMAAAVVLFGFGLWALSLVVFSGASGSLKEAPMITSRMASSAEYSMERPRVKEESLQRNPSSPSQSENLIAAAVPESAIYIPEVAFDTEDIDIGTSASLGEGFGGSGTGGFGGVAARMNEADADAFASVGDQGKNVDAFAAKKPSDDVDAFESRSTGVAVDPFAAAPSDGEDRFADSDDSVADPFAASAPEPKAQSVRGENNAQMDKGVDGFVGGESQAIIAGNRSGDYPITRDELDSTLKGRGQEAAGMPPVVTNFPVTPATPTAFETDENGEIYPTEYDPPELPNSVGVAPARLGANTNERSDMVFFETSQRNNQELGYDWMVQDEGKKADGKESSSAVTSFPASPATPTAFEKDESGLNVSTRGGDASALRVIRESTYPTEYEPPELPNSVGGKADGQIPMLGDVPVNGRLFRSDSDSVVEGLSKVGNGRVEQLADRRLMLNQIDQEWELDEKAAELGSEGEKAQLVADASSLDPFEDVGEIVKPTPELNPAPQVALDEIFLEQSAADEGVSTFSLHVNDASFKVVAALLESGQWPDAEKIREEEFVNALDYGDLSPSAAERISAKVEQAAHPFIGGRNLVRIGLRTASVGRDTRMPLHLTILLDTSGSMEREDRREIVARSLASLATMLGENDVVSMIGFSRNSRLLLDRVPGNRAGELAKTAMALPAEGGTNIETALTLAGEIAERQFNADGQNRIVMLTDGAANLGGVDAERLMAMGSQFREMGVALDCYGVGIDGLDDAVLEALTRKGDGRYFVLNAPQDADEEFANAVAGTLSPLALDVKVQVRFNPDRVGGYRLIGFRKQRLNEEDFRNDAVDGGEIAAAAEGNALYQVEVVPDGVGDIGEVWVRFRDARTGEMVEKQWRIPYDENVKSLADAGETMKMAGLAGLFAEALLKGSEIGGDEVGELEGLARDVVARRDYDEGLKAMAEAVSDAAEF